MRAQFVVFYVDELCGRMDEQARAPASFQVLEALDAGIEGRLPGFGSTNR